MGAAAGLKGRTPRQHYDAKAEQLELVPGALPTLNADGPNRASLAYRLSAGAQLAGRMGEPDGRAVPVCKAH